MKRSTFLFSIASLLFFGQGCLGPAKGPAGPDLGVYKTLDGGQTWTHKRTLVSGPKITGAVASMSILTMVFDPQDRSTIYLGTAENGIVFTRDGGDSWQRSKSLTTGRVNAVAVDAKNKCTVYAASGNKLYKTSTCGLDWSQIFFNPRTDVSFTRIAVDWYNPTILFAGSSDGDVFRSVDSGEHWQVAKRVDGIPITSIVIDPRDSRVIYAGTQSDWIWKSADGGVTWAQIKKQFGDDLPDARRIVQIVADPVAANVVYSVSKYGILKSLDGGASWTPQKLTSPPSTMKINALAIDPKNNQRLVFAGVATLQFSDDGGASWTPKKLPTTQTGSSLLIDPLETNTIFLGTVPAPQKK
ncbi:MAG: YCF48-related protein [Patescibacteria group bacterium]